jgi:hypothetical protein
MRIGELDRLPYPPQVGISFIITLSTCFADKGVVDVCDWPFIDRGRSRSAEEAVTNILYNTPPPSTEPFKKCVFLFLPSQTLSYQNMPTHASSIHTLLHFLNYMSTPINESPLRLSSIPYPNTPILPNTWPMHTYPNPYTLTQPLPILHPTPSTHLSTHNSTNNPTTHPDTSSTASYKTSQESSHAYRGFSPHEDSTSTL